MTKLYLQNGTAPTGTPTSENSTALPNGTATGTPATAPLSTANTAGGSVLHGISTTNDTAHRDYCRYIFGWTIPVTQAIAANNWTFAMGGVEGNAASNQNFEFSLYVYRPGTGVIGTRIYDAHDTSLAGLFAEFPSNSSSAGLVATISGNAVAGAAANDLLVLEVWVHATQSMTTSYSSDIYFSGTADITQGGSLATAGAAYISTPQDLETLPPVPVSASDSATAADEVTAKASVTTESGTGDDAVATLDAVIIGGSPWPVYNAGLEVADPGNPWWSWYATYTGGVNPGPTTTRAADGTAPEGAYVGVQSHTVATAGQNAVTSTGHRDDGGQCRPTPGATYVLSVWVKASRADQVIAISGGTVNAALNDISFYANAPGITRQPSDGWVLQSFRWGPFPADAYSISFGLLGVTQATAGEMFRFDLFEIDPVAGDVATAVDTAVVSGASTPIAANDSGVGTDTSDLAATLTVTDSGSGADTAPTLGKDVTDAAVGTDASGKGMTVADAATGADVSALSVPIPVNDSATGADASALTAAIPVTDTGVGADSIPTLAKAVTDAATAADTSSVTTGNQVNATDSAVGADASALTAALAASDSGTAADTATVAAGTTASITSPLPSLTQLLSAVSIAPLTPVFDSFNRADGVIGTSDSGHTWIEQSGTWFIGTNRAYRIGSEMQSTVVIDSGFTTCSLSVDATFPAGLQDSGLVFAATDDNNYLLLVFEVSPGPLHELRLWKRDAGAFTLLSGPHTVPNYSSTTKRARVEWDAANGEIEIWFDFVQVTTVTLGSTDRATYALATRQGLRENAVPAGDKTYFDNYSLTPPAMPALSTLVMARSANTTGWSDPASDTTMEGAGTQVIVVTAGV